MEGNISAVERVNLGNEANLKGDVKAARIVIEEGARFEGKCDMQNTALITPSPKPEDKEKSV